MNNTTNDFTFFDLVKLHLVAILIPNMVIHLSTKNLISLEWRSIIVQIIIVSLLLGLYKKKLLITKHWSNDYLSNFYKKITNTEKIFIKIFIIISFIWPFLFVLIYSDSNLFEKHVILYGKKYGSLEIIFSIIIGDLVRWVSSVIYSFEVMFNYMCKFSKIVAISIGTVLIINISSIPSSLIGFVLTITTDIVPPLLLTLIYNSSKNLILILFLIFTRWIIFSSMIVYLHFKLV